MTEQEEFEFRLRFEQEMQSDRKRDFKNAVNQRIAKNPAEYDASSKEFQAKYGPTAGNSFLKNAVIGFDKGVTNLGQGIKQAAVDFYERANPLENIKRSVGIDTYGTQLKQEELQRRKTDAPLMQTGGGKTGNIAGTLAVTAPFFAVPALNTETGAALGGLAFGATQPVASDKERAKFAATGAVSGAVGKRLGDDFQSFLNARVNRRIAQNEPDIVAEQLAEGSTEIGPGVAQAGADVQMTPTMAARSKLDFGTVGPDASKGLTTAQREALKAGQALGMRVTPGQAVGSKALQQQELKLASQPISSGTFNAIEKNNSEVLSKAFLRAIGEKGDEITPGVLASADDRIGSVYERVLGKESAPWTPELESRLAEIQSNAGAELLEGEAKIINRQIDEILKKAVDNSGKIPGNAYQRIRQSLSRLSNSTSQGVGTYARQIRDSLDDAFISSAGPKTAKELTDARQQYRVLITALNRTGAVNSSAGKISPYSLANAFSQSDMRGFALGKKSNDLYKALQFMNAFKPIVGDSGTATRLPQGMFEIGMAIPTRIATGAYASSPAVKTAMKLQQAAGYAGPFADVAAQYTAPFVRGPFQAGAQTGPFVFDEPQQ